MRIRYPARKSRATMCIERNFASIYQLALLSRISKLTETDITWANSMLRARKNNLYTYIRNHENAIIERKYIFAAPAAWKIAITAIISVSIRDSCTETIISSIFLASQFARQFAKCYRLIYVRSRVISDFLRLNNSYQKRLHTGFLKLRNAS